MPFVTCEDEKHVTDLKFLVSRLNPVCRDAMENAAASALERGHAEVDTLHLLLELADAKRTDAAAIFSACSIDMQRLGGDARAALAKVPGSQAKMPSLSNPLVRVLSVAWNVASGELASEKIRSGAILLALIDTGISVQMADTVSAELLKLSGREIREARSSLFGAEEGSQPGASPSRSLASESTLAQYTIDLTAAARSSALDPVVGRDAEIRKVIDILTRRRQNNPILTGEPGVGKTAIAEGVALRVAAGDVPPSLRNVRVLSLDVGLLLAGASMRGEFEQRLKSVIREAQSAEDTIVLFIDEAHMLVGGNGQTDAANLLKPALARGELRTIAATTLAEYRKYFEKDPALARRFQVVMVEEPSEEAAVNMVRRLVPALEKHHGVRLTGQAVEAAVRLSRRYITGRQLPDKAIATLDTACARVAIARTSTPAAVEDCQQLVAALEEELAETRRDRFIDGDSSERMKSLFDRLAVAEERLADLEDRCREERKLIGSIEQTRAALDDLADDGDGENLQLRAELHSLDQALESLQGERPLVPAVVDARVIAGVISENTGIPVGQMLRRDLNTVASLRNALEERVAGQCSALDIIARRIVSARAGLEDPSRPTGVFLLAGPSGVGKTETALALADLLYGGERNAVIINMSEYQEPHSISGLKGSPPGYVGYGEGGILTEAVRHRPYCVLLLDEVEKAHRDIHELFYQIFDKGTMEDSQGLTVDFRNTLILMTSNTGAETIRRKCAGDPSVSSDCLRDAIYPELRTVFQPALLSRMIIVPYHDIGESALHRIVEVKIARIARRLQETHGLTLECSDGLLEEIAHRCTGSESGARSVDHILTGTLVPEISERLLSSSVSRKYRRILVDPGSGGTFRYRFE